jgi:acetate kinase
MGARRGDVDAGVLAFLERTEKLTATQSENAEQEERFAGHRAFRAICANLAADEGHHAPLASKYSYRVRKYLGAYVASMGG